MRNVIVIQINKGYCGEGRVEGLYESQVQRIEIDADGLTSRTVMLPGFDLTLLSQNPLRVYFNAQFSRPSGRLGQLKIVPAVSKY